MAKRGDKHGGDTFGNIANNVYDGAATFGRIMALISLIMSCIIGTIMIVIGIILLFKKNKYSAVTSGKITMAQCNTANNITSCSISADYIANDKTYKITAPVNDKYYNLDDNINIYYDPNEPAASLARKPFSFMWIGIILIVIAFFIIGGAALYYYIVTRFKFVAAATGVGNIIDIVD